MTDNKGKELTKKPKVSDEVFQKYLNIGINIDDDETAEAAITRLICVHYGKDIIDISDDGVATCNKETYHEDTDDWTDEEYKFDPINSFEDNYMLIVDMDLNVNWDDDFLTVRSSSMGSVKLKIQRPDVYGDNVCVMARTVAEVAAMHSSREINEEERHLFNQWFHNLD